MNTQKPSGDLSRILRVLNKNKVDYLVVGGYGTVLHGSHVVTTDVDICPKNSSENYERLSAALIELKGKLRGVEDFEVPISGGLLSNMQIGTWNTIEGDFDILHSIPSGPDGQQYGYEKLFEKRKVGKSQELVVFVASLEDIIASKRFAGRPKDLAVLPELEELLRQQSEVE